MRRILMTATLILGYTGAVLAAFSGNDAGTSTAAFLKLGAGARAIGLGGSFTAAADDATSIYWNPAGLSRIEGNSLSVMHAAWFESMFYDWVSYARNMKGIGTLGIGVQYFSYGSLTEMDITGNEGSSFSPADSCVSLSFARKFAELGLGVNVKYVSSKIKNTAAAVAFDAGAQYPLMDRRLWLGVAAQNMGTKMKFVDNEDPLPFIARLGGAFRITGSWLATADICAPSDNDPYYSAGTEYGLKINTDILTAARIGYTTINRDTGGTNGITAGVGVTYRGYGIDYAFAPYGDLGQTHLFSLKISF